MALLFGALSGLAPLSIDMYLPSLPTLARQLHTNASFAQLSLTMCLLGLALGQLVAGPLSDRFGRRRPLIVGMAVYTVTAFLCAIAPSVWLLITIRLLQGLSGAFGIVIARAATRDLYSGTELTRFYALLMLVSGVAPIAAPVIGGQLLRFTSWRGVFVVLGVVSIAITVSVIAFLRETLPQGKRSSGGVGHAFATFGRLLRDRAFMGYASSQGLVFAAMFGYISGSPFVLQNMFGISAQMFSVVFAVNGAGIILSSQVAGRLVGRYTERSILKGGLALAGVAGVVLLGVIVIHPSLFGVIVPLFFVVSSVGCVSTTATSLALHSQGKAAGSAAALIGVPQLLAGAVVAPFTGIAGSHAAGPMGIVIAVCEIGAVLSFVLLNRRVRGVDAGQNALGL
ncbi:multidrug effflux MFS transporter [Alicyclobacillus sp. ALC3]|uniref:multidrug effflux MFS transporter n=1 Tax=Alicyclobacillus sp. ALC3 TaxID=2796143 RepID=UPI0023781573|nr:multidrug effflux MFS transporter [Alicyclobacillus sp. ALC3]WDL99460.1 multidrug effflux MFS transporter [Alicyclobacillus sp. ALC3]